MRGLSDRLAVPHDPAQWLALGLAAAVAMGGVLVFRPRTKKAPFVALSALAALLLSYGYVQFYLRGGPRIIDATSYFLEARGMAHGLLSFRLDQPEASVLGRFLVRSEHADGAHAAVIFPPGYPAILALGFLAGDPLLVGPILAAALIVATYALARSVSRELDLPLLPKVACLLSVSCAALRYHTADTMSHGLAALCFTAALALGFRAMNAVSRGALPWATVLAMGSGLSTGWLFATRPVSGGVALATLASLAWTLARPGSRPTAAQVLWMLSGFAAGTLPGVGLFLVEQHAATGHWFGSSQSLYYAVSDGPPNCFRYGFGTGVGCLGEHGDVVEAHLRHGYGLAEALGTTARRLTNHLVDPLNLELLWPLVPIGAYFARRARAGRVLSLAFIAIVLGYAPFYFSGSYPGGGARFYADVLPCEHVLAAVAIACFVQRRASPERWAGYVIAAVLAGFAFRASVEHRSLREREGGRPMFDPRDLEQAGITHALVFVDTDHGFNLAYDPSGTSKIQVARYHADALDGFTWEARGRLPAFLYHFELDPRRTPGAVSLVPLLMPQREPLVIEGESLWPPIHQTAGYALPEWASGTCASSKRWLGLHTASASIPASARVALPARAIAGSRIAVRVAYGKNVSGQIIIQTDDASQTWNLLPRETSLSCETLAPFEVPVGTRRTELTITREGQGDPLSILALDAIVVNPTPTWTEVKSH